jgi:tRNA1(Val) A37 N6-methylase TrmN6
MSDADLLLSEDRFLGGRLRLKQPQHGHRAGHDAMLLAAATPARSGDRVVEFGAGVGAAGLAVASRLRNLDLVLVERDERLAAIARENLVANNIRGRVIALDITHSAKAFADAGLPPDSAERVMMNPPFNDATLHQPSPDELRRSAHEGEGDALEVWTRAARRILKPGGTLTLIWRADGIARVLAAVDAGFGGVVVLPVHPRPAAAAIRILVRATKGSRAALTLLPGVMLSTASGRADDAMQAVLNGTAVLPLAST